MTCRMADAEAAVQTVGPFTSTLSDHPVASAVAHIIFIAVVMALGASIVAALFKSPFQH